MLFILIVSAAVIYVHCFILPALTSSLLLVLLHESTERFSMHFDCVSWPAAFIFPGKTLEENILVCLSTSRRLLWGLSDTRHKLWVWMAPWWPWCSCGSGAQTPTRAHATFNSTELQSRTRWAWWRVIWLLWRAASSVCAGELQFWHPSARHPHITKTQKKSTHSTSLPFCVLSEFSKGSRSCEGRRSDSLISACCTVKRR